jgi:uncharacterized protein (TIGR02996 family)
MRLESTLLTKIAADPEDMAPRLACADWLEKQGAGPRAALIRAQIALRTRLNPAQRLAFGAQVRELLKEHGKAWAAELPGVDRAELNYSRGFIQELGLTEKRLTEHGEELLAREPVFRLRVEVQDGRGLASVCAQPWFERIRWLKLTGKVDAGATALAAAPHVGHLEGLLLPGATVKGVSALAQSEQLKGLKWLSLTGSGELDGEALAVLAEGRLALERLYLTAIMLEEGLSDWVEGAAFQSLKWLALNRNNLSDDDAKALAGSEALQNLEVLELAQNEITEKGALAFRSPEVIPRLKRLDLSGMYYDTKKLAPLRQRFGRGLKL